MVDGVLLVTPLRLIPKRGTLDAISSFFCSSSNLLQYLCLQNAFIIVINNQFVLTFWQFRKKLEIAYNANCDAMAQVTLTISIPMLNSCSLFSKITFVSRK